MLPASEIMEDIDTSLPMWCEMVCVLIFTLGCSLLRLHRMKSVPAKMKRMKKIIEEPSDTVAKTIEVESSAGNHEATIEAWRAVWNTVAVSADSLRSIVQALIQTSLTTLVDDLIDYMTKHESLWTSSIAATVLDTVARAGQVDLLEPLLEAFTRRMNIRISPQINEVVLGGYAFHGCEEQILATRKRMELSGERMTPRAHSLLFRGLLRSRREDACMRQAKNMVACGYTIPSFAVQEIFRVFCEAGRGAEVLNEASPEIVITTEAAAVLFEYSLKTQDVELAARVRLAMGEMDVSMNHRCYDSLLKLLASVGNQTALEVFEEMQGSGFHITEGFCVSLLARSAEVKFLRFAEIVIKYARTHLQMSIGLFSSLMKVYAYSGMYDKACDLYDQILAAGLEPDHMMYNCLMKFAAMCGRVELSQTLSEKVPHLDIQNCMSLIQAAYKNKDVGRACEVLEKLKSTGQVPDTAAYNCALDVCAVAGDVKRARELLAEMKELGTLPDVITYNTVLKGLAVIGDMKRARRLLLEMEEDGFTPNDISFNVLINMAVSNGSLQDALEVVDSMTKKGVQVDRYTMSTLMKAVKRTKNTRDVQLVFGLLDRSKVVVADDEVLLNTVLETCIRHREKSRVRKILDSYSATKQLRPAVHTYGMLIRAYSMLQRIEKCRDLWYEMTVLRAHEPNEIVLGCMLDALVSSGFVDDGLELLRQWRGRVRPNAVMYSTLLKGFASSHRASRSLELLEEMRADVKPMCTSLYNSLIDVQARSGNTEEVCRLRKLMEEDRCAADDFTTSLVVKSYAVRGNLKTAFEVFHSLASRIGEGDAVVFNTLLDGCVRHNDFKSAEHLLENIDQYKVKPTNFTLGIVVKMWGRRRQLDEAFKAIDHMTKRYGFSVNAPVRTCLMCACLMNDDIKRAVETFADIKKSCHGADAKAYGSLISGAARLGSFDLASRLVDEVCGLSGCTVSFLPREIDAGVLDQLARSLAKAGQMESIGVPIFSKLSAKGVPVGNHLVSLLNGASNDGRR